MLLTEFDQKAYEEFIKDESFEEGLSEGKRTSLLRILNRMGNIPEKIESTIKEINDTATLDAWLDVALDARNLEEFADKIMITSN